MKKLAVLIAVLAFLTDSYAQFEGTLVYDCTLKTKVMMTVYETKGKVRVEAKSYPMKQGAADILKGKEEDPLLFDFQTNKQLRFVDKRRAVVETEFSELEAEKQMKLTDGDISVEKTGEEVIGKLNCQHFVVKIKGDQRDLWITKDLGASNICLAGILLYYPAGSMILNKIKSAGGDGVVVKSQIGDQVVNLTNYQTRMPPAYNFEIPAGYTKM
ncbi:MAG: DUF4412 domain-containing protein [Bacteroidetes bacterium]|nr:DUF4412 domain-containing protein [Bacteroidota bacterium]